MLTDSERDLVHELVARGPSALVEEGYDSDSLREFISRKDTQDELALLGKEFNNQEALRSLERFVTRRRLSGLSRASVAILAQALRGPVYARDADGNILVDALGRPVLREPEPTKGQRVAAQDVLDRMGVGTGRKESAVGVNIDFMIKTVDEMQVKIRYGEDAQSEEDRTLSRERVRAAMEVLRSRFDDLKELTTTALEGTDGKKETGKKGRAKKKRSKAAREKTS